MNYFKKIIASLLVILMFLLQANTGYAKEVIKEKDQFVWGNGNNYKAEETILIPKNVDFSTFEGNNTYPKVKKIIFEEGIESLGRFAFFPFPNVKEIIFPSTLEDIGRAFHTIRENEKINENYFLSKLEDIEVSKENLYFLSMNGILYSKDQTSLLHYPSSKPEKVYIMPEFVTSLGEQAFGYNIYLEKIVLGTRFGLSYKPFSDYGNLPNLQTFEVTKDNLYYTVEGGVWFNNDKTALIAYPQGKKQKRYIIPSTVKNIAIDSFKYATIDTLVLPSGLINLYEPDNSEYKYPPLSGSFISNYEITNHQKYETVDGVLYNKDKTQLVAWPSKKSVEHLKFPSTITSLTLDESTIPTIRKVKKITIPRDLKELKQLSWYSDEAKVKGLSKERWDSLETIEVEKGNKNFILYGGLLYKKDNMNLTLLPSKAKITTLTIPENCNRDTSYRYFLPEMPSVTKIIITGDAYNFPYELFPNLATFELSKGNKKAKLVNGVLYSSSQKTLIWYPQNKKGSSFTVPSSVTTFRNDTFEIQNYLETIVLPKNLDISGRFHATRFLNCKKLKQIKVDSSSPYLTAVDGVLYDKKKTILYCYPSAKTASSFVMPDTVSTFFVSTTNNYLKSLTLGKNFSQFTGNNNIYLEGFTKLENITIKENYNYVIIDGVLYQNYWWRGELNLMIYPQAKKDKSFIIREEVSDISYKESLINHKYLENIISKSPAYKVIPGNILHKYELY